MSDKRKKQPKTKNELHPRNKHRERYDWEVLTTSFPALAPFIRPNKYGDDSIDFFDPKAVKTLNQALVKRYYNITEWEVPAGYLSPAIPGRADYIHSVADLLSFCNNDIIPRGRHIRCLDIGTGAGCIYPIIGVKEYGWSFLASDVDVTALDSAKRIVKANPALKTQVELALQSNPKKCFKRMIEPGERFDVTICNPPFHVSAEAAAKANRRKVSNLKGKRQGKPALNFGGHSNELWCEGGEVRFIRDMIEESKRYSKQVYWFTTLVSKAENLKYVYRALKTAKATEVETIPMSQGNKVSRIVAWNFLYPPQQAAWVKLRWNREQEEE